MVLVSYTAENIKIDDEYFSEVFLKYFKSVCKFLRK